MNWPGWAGRSARGRWPFALPRNRYLARYVGRTAISDERLVAADDDAVTFRYTDSATQQKKLCTLGAAEFLRRYLQHVLPPGQPFRLRSRP